MKDKISYVLIIILIASLGMTGCSRHLEHVKLMSEETAKSNRLSIVGYEGYQWDIFCGAKVWYMFRTIPDRGILYHGAFFQRPFSKEIHLVNFKAIDAIKP